MVPRPAKRPHVTEGTRRPAPGAPLLPMPASALDLGTLPLVAQAEEALRIAAIAFESVVKLIAFLAVGLFVVYGLFNGLADVFARAHAVPELAKLLRLEQGGSFAWTQWFAMTLLSMFSVIFLNISCGSTLFISLCIIHCI